MIPVLVKTVIPRGFRGESRQTCNNSMGESTCEYNPQLCCYVLPSPDDSKERAGFFYQDIDDAKLKPGDHIYVYRTAYLYCHHGIYIGKKGREVIHFSGNGQGKSKTTAKITACTLQDFKKDRVVKLVKYDVSLLEQILKGCSSTHVTKSKPAKEVIEIAEGLLRNPELFGDYHVLFNNCETFAFYCKTGMHNVSGQVRDILPILPTLDEYAMKIFNQ